MIRPFVLAGAVVMATTPLASAQQYAARRNGDVVQLEDAKSQIVVSIVPSVGNIAFSMKVKARTCCAGRTRPWRNSKPGRA